MSISRRSERHYQVHVYRNLKRNYRFHLVHGLFGRTGFMLLNAPTFLPAYLLLLANGSDLIVGLCLALQALGMTLGPIYGASLISHRPRVLPTGLLTGGCMRVTLLLIAIVGFFLAPLQALIATAALLFLFGFFAGVQGVIFNFLLSKVIPVRRRGQLTGLRNFLSGITASAVAYAAGNFLIGLEATTSGYSRTFLLAFVLTTLGLIFLAFVREAAPPTTGKRSSSLEHLREIPRLLKSDSGFARYVLARFTAGMGRMAMPFYILYAGADSGFDGATLGMLTFSFTISATISNLIWGRIADYTGFRFVMGVAIGLWILSSLGLMAASGLWQLMLTFAGIGAAFQGFQNASINMTLEFGDRRDLPLRIAVANMIGEASATIGPLLGGLLATLHSYQLTFGVAIFFLSLGLVTLCFTPEPRRTI